MKTLIQISVLLLFLTKTSVCFGYGPLVGDTNVVITKNPVRFAKLIAYKDVQPLVKGLIDVTKGPYFAMGDGSTDDTQAIKDAIQDAYDANYTVFFPGDKVYLVSSQLRCERIATSSNHKFGFNLMGSTKGKKPVIKLKDNSTVTGNILVYFNYNSITVTVDAPSHYGAQYRGIDIDMGHNPAVSALSMQGAQYCSIEDVNIFSTSTELGVHFNAGICDLPGSGGNTVNVSVDGGNYGISENAYRPNPSITGLTLTNQLINGIRLTYTRGPLVITGFKIVSPAVPSSTYNAVYVSCGTSPTNVQGSLCLTDGSIEVFGSTGKAIFNQQNDITINNVYVKASQIIANSTSTKALAGNANAWKKISRYVCTTLAAKSTVYADFVKLNPQTGAYDLSELANTTDPIPNFTTTHVWGVMPSWEDTNLVDISTYGATAENVNKLDDDGIAIQNAIDDVTNPVSANYRKTVFIPRGHFHVSGSLSFKSGLKIIGAGKSFSAIQCLKNKNYAGVPFIQTDDDANGSLIMSDFAVLMNPNMNMFNFRTNNTIFRDVATEHAAIPQWENPASTLITNTNKQIVPALSFTGNAGGKFYGVSTDHISSYIPTTGRIPLWHIIYVNSNLHPISFYQLSVEHRVNRSQVMLNNARNVSIYAFKYEGVCELANIINSDSIKIIGGSGNYSLDSPDDQGIIVINNSKNVTIQNVCYVPNTTNIIGKWVKSDQDAGSAPSSAFGVLSYTIGNIPTNTAIVNEKESNIKVFTNSVTKELLIEGLLPNEMVEIFNAQGLKMLNIKNTQDNLAHIDINNLAIGIYIVKMNKETVKFVKNF